MSDINIIENSIWPTTDGRLGINKVPIPDGVNTFWPEGNALVKNFIYKDDKLVGYIDTKSLIENETKTSVLPYEYVDITLDKRLEYSMTFEKGENCKYFNIKYEVSLPSGYKRLLYLESTGTQFIDVDYAGGCTAKFRHAVLATGPYSDGWGRWGQNGALDNNRGAVWYANKTRYDFYACFNVGDPYVKGEFNDVVHELCDNNTVLALTVNGARKSTGAGGTYNPTSYSLFDRRGGTRERLKYCSISAAGKLIRDFYPALDPTGAPCLYDVVSGTPFYNGSADDFVYPNMDNQSSTYSLRNRMYAKMTEHGIRRLYHVPIDYSGTKEDYASENGFKQLVELSKPEEGNWIPNWRETDTELICEWIEEEIPSEI